MKIEEVIKKAFQGGWKGDGAKFNGYIEMFRDIHWYRNDGYAENLSLEQALLDPLFWQSLGKALGWNLVVKNIERGKEWLWYWHRFIDHLAEGKTAEDFFSTLSV